VVNKPVYFLLLFALSSCTLPEKKEKDMAAGKPNITTLQSSDTNAADKDSILEKPLPFPKPIKKPQGVYQTILPYSEGIEQTIAFYNDFTYRLQEKYINTKKDSVLITTGNWSPSDGYIWLYKNQIVRARYSWKGDSLQYFSPYFKKTFSMHPLKNALENAVLRNKKTEGIILYGAGNQSLWNVELNDKDSVSFSLAEWAKPIVLKINSAASTADSSIFFAKNDSTQLKIIALPFFCTDGEFVYRNKIKVEYNNHVYSGCGVLFR
jgi:NlpE-like protein